MERAIEFLGENWLFLLFLAVIAAAFFFLRSSPTDLANASEFDAILANGQPAVVEFYSNY
jgi:hypothetical protein